MASLSERSLKRREERRHMMGNMRIPKLIPLMAVPTIISMLVSSAYNLADTFFVSSLGTAATAAVGVNAALAEVIMMAGSFLAVGANSYIARLMGAKKDKQASQVLSTSFFSAIFTGGFVMVFGLLFMEPLCYLLGATDEILHHTIDYASYVLYAAPFMASSFVLNQCLRSEGSATYSMIGMMIGAVLNIGLDPIFIFTLDLGVLGASLATAISKLVSFLVLLFPYITRRSLLHLSFKNIHYNRDIVLEITRMGSPSLLRSGLNTIAITITNNIAGAFSASALAAISVVNRVMRFLVAAILGFGQGFQPVAGFNWGARRYDRVREAYRFSSIVGVGVISAFAVLLFVFSKPVILIFTEADLEMLRIGSFCLRLQCLVMPIHAWGIVVNMLYAGTGHALGAAILSLSRQGICFIPMLLILPKLFGVMGLAAAQGTADGLTIFMILPLAIRMQRELNKRIANPQLYQEPVQTMSDEDMEPDLSGE